MRRILVVNDRKFLHFDMEGFAQQQIASMSSYDQLLIELGEKTYVPEESKLPVEIRLLGMIVVNCNIYCSKMIMKKTGSNIMGMMNASRPSKSKQPKKMRSQVSI